MKKLLLKTMLLLCALVAGSTSVWGDTKVAVNDVLWTEPFKGTNTATTFSATSSWGNYVNPTTFVSSDASSLVYSSSNAMLNSTTSTNMDGAHVWLNKSVDGYIQVAGIKLYNATKVKVSWAQATSGSSATVYYQFDGEGDFTELSTCSGPNAEFNSSELSVSDHTTITLKFAHPKSNAKNTRIDKLTLTVTEIASSDPSSAVAFVNTTPSISIPAVTTYSQVPTTAAGYLGTISYEITTNTAGATINSETGLVTVTREGSVTVKATAAAVPGSFSSSEATYTLTVNDTRTSAGLVWNAVSADVTYDSDSNVFPTLTNPNGVDVTYTSSNTSAATINSTTGVITLKDVNASTTIKASFAGNDTYKPQEVSYTLNVTKAPFAVRDGVFDFESAAKQEPLEDYGSGMTLVSDGYTTDSKTWTAVNVKMVTSKVSGNGYRWWKADGTLRFYNGSKATFSVPSGYVITQIVTTGANFDEANTGTLSGATWTGISNEVSLSVTATRNIKTITVTYIADYNPASITLNDKGYATFASTKAVDFSGAESNGYSAWAVTNVDGTTITFSPIAGTVPAGTGVLLKGAASATVSPVYTTGGDAPASNLLSGILTSTDVIADQYYGLKGNEFVKVNAGTVPAGKALLPAGSVGSARALSMVFEGVDGIESIQNSKSEIQNAIFDLSGRRVVKPTKGLYIVNGKKIVK